MTPISPINMNGAENKDHHLRAEPIPGTHKWEVTDSSSYSGGTYQAEVEYLGADRKILFWRNNRSYWVGWRLDTGRCSNNAELARVLAELS